MKQFIIWTYSSLLLMGAIAYAVLYFLFPEYYFEWYVAIPLSFCIIELGMSFLPLLTKGQSATKTTNVFLGFKGVKFLIIVVLCFLYFKLIGVQRICFTIMVFLFYSITLAMETIFVLRLLKNRDV